jgi:hypothetical protein
MERAGLAGLGRLDRGGELIGILARDRNHRIAAGGELAGDAEAETTK